MKLIDRLFPFKSPPAKHKFNAEGKRALIISTSQASLDKQNKKGVWIKGKASGVHASELTEPYLVFEQAGMNIDLASIKGGEIPFDPMSLWPMMKTNADKILFASSKFMNKVNNSFPIHQLQPHAYDIIFIAGGFAAAYDLEQSQDLADFISEAYSLHKVIASVCHGALGLCSAIKPNGEPLIKDLEVTGVSNKQIKQLGVWFTPKHPETSIKEAGGIYSKQHKALEVFASKVLVEKDHQLVSGQNQKSAIATAEAALQLL